MKQMAALIGGVLIAVPALGQARYVITDLGDLPGGDNFSYAVGLNNTGQVVGVSDTAFGGPFGDSGYHAFFWQAGSPMIDLGKLPGGYDMSRATGVNDVGLVVGYSTANMTTYFRGFTWHRVTNQMQDIGTVAGGVAYYAATGVNNSGHIAMENWTENGGRYDAYLWVNGQWTPVPDHVAGAHFTISSAIGGSDAIVGGSGTNGNDLHAFLWTFDHGTRDLGVLSGGSRSWANSLSESGVVVGYSLISESAQHAFRWNDVEGMRDLGALYGGSSEAFGVDNAGRVVGSSTLPDGSDTRASIWLNDGTVVYLGDLLVNGSGWLHLRAANAINSAGQIVGNGTLTNGDVHAFLLTPVACYANCDGSTLQPVLSANDFQCFLDAFASGSPYANCDGSTVVPALTANDFQCFLNRFAAGCT
jgi:probable HAF family extracellular repeat protein